MMVLGSFQCRGVLLLLHIVGQGPAVPAAGAGWMGYIFFFYIFSSPELVVYQWSVVRRRPHFQT